VFSSDRDLWISFANLSVACDVSDNSVNALQIVSRCEIPNPPLPVIQQFDQMPLMFSETFFLNTDISFVCILGVIKYEDIGCH